MALADKAIVDAINDQLASERRLQDGKLNLPDNHQNLSAWELLKLGVAKSVPVRNYAVSTSYGIVPQR